MKFESVILFFFITRSLFQVKKFHHNCRCESCQVVAFFPNLESKENIGKLKSNCLFQIPCKIVFYAHFSRCSLGGGENKIFKKVKYLQTTQTQVLKWMYVAVAYLCKVAPLEKLKCASLHNNLNITADVSAVLTNVEPWRDKFFKTKNIFLFLFQTFQQIKYK